MADPVSVAINIAIQVAISIAIAALTPKQRLEGPRLEDKTITSSAYGEPISIPYGTVKVAGNVIWGKEIREETISEEIGKGGVMSAGTSTQYFYYGTFATAIAKREIGSLIRIYADGKVIYDAAGGEGSQNMSGLSFRFYNGSDDQLVDPLMAADVPDGEMPAYRGTCYIVFDDIPLENFGNRIPNMQFVVSTEASSGKPTVRQFPNPELNNGTSISFNQRDLVMYDKARNVIFTHQYADATSPFTPHFIAARDADTGAILATKDIEDITNGDFIKARLWVGGSSPWIIMTCSTAFQEPVYVIEKDTLSLLGKTTGNRGLVLPYSDDGRYSGEPKLDPSAGGIQFQVIRGNTAPWYYMTGSNGGLVDGNGYAAETILSLPDLAFAYTRNAGGDTNIGPLIVPITNSSGREWGDPTGNGGGYGISGWGMGRQGLGWTDIYWFARTTKLHPWTTKLMYVRVGLNGSPMIGPIKIWDFDSEIAAVGSMTLHMAYDKELDVMVCYNNTLMHALKLNTSNSKLQEPTPVEIWRKAANEGLLSNMYDHEQRELQDGYFITKKPGGAVETLSANFNKYDTLTGQLLETLSFGDWPTGAQFLDAETGAEVDFVQNTVEWYDYENNRLLGADGGTFFGWWYLQAAKDRNGESLDTVVRDIVTRSKLTAADIDVTELSTKTVRGYNIGSEMTFRSALQPLATAYDFYARENAGIMEFKFNTKTSHRTIPEDDLLMEEGSNIFEESRGQELEVPRALYVKYNTSDWVDEKNTQIVRRISDPTPAMGSVGEVNLELPMTLSDAEAAEIAERVMYESWVRRESFQFRLPQRYLELLPNDNLTIAAVGRIDNMRVNRLSIGSTLDMEIEGTLIDGANYASLLLPAANVGSPSYRRKDTVIGNNIPTAKGFLLDMPLMQDGDLTGRDSGSLMYVMAGVPPTGANKQFAGAALQTSFNGDVFQTRSNITSEMSWGILSTVMADIPDANWNAVQETSIDVTIFAGASDFASVTEADMIGNDSNTAILYRPMTNQIEVIGFRDVETVVIDDFGNTTERLTGFMRGKRGTDQMATDYPAIAVGPTYIIIADEEKIKGFVEANSRLASEASYQFRPPTHELTAITTDTVTYQHRALMPYAPWGVFMTLDDPSTGNRNIQWVRRTRQGGSWKPQAIVPVSEDTESYEIDILSGTGGTVLRTLTSTDPSVLYSQEQADIDFGTDFPNPLYVRVYQISAQVGRGFSYEAALQEA